MVYGLTDSEQAALISSLCSQAFKSRTTRICQRPRTQSQHLGYIYSVVFPLFVAPKPRLPSIVILSREGHGHLRYMDHSLNTPSQQRAMGQTECTAI